MMRSLGSLMMAAALLAVIGCSPGADPTAPPAAGQIQISMTDAPGAFDAVNLVIDEVAVNVGHDDGGWQVLISEDQTIDLLTLQNGVFTTIADAAVAAGTYAQVRIKLAPGSNVVVDGVTYPLTIPSAVQSGIKTSGTYHVPAQGLLAIQLDFDAGQSVRQTGPGEYSIVPVVRVLPAAEAGAIAGVVLTGGADAIVQVAQDGIEVATTWAAADGSFSIHVLPAGTYTVTISTIRGVQAISGVVVTGGSTTSLGTITFPSLGDGDPELPPRDGDVG